MQNNPNPAPDAIPTDALRSEVDAAFDDFIRTRYIMPFGKSGLRETFHAGFAAARGEQPVPPVVPSQPKPVYPLKRRAT